MGLNGGHFRHLFYPIKNSEKKGLDVANFFAIGPVSVLTIDTVWFLG